MDKTKSLILNSLKYWDTNNEKYTNFFNKAVYYRILEGSADLDQNKIVFYDKNKVEFYTSRYEILGGYFKDIKLWVWGWVMGNKKNEIIIAKKLLNYGLDLGTEFNFLKSELITSRFRLTSEFQLDIHVAVASYISKNPLIFKLITTANEYEYFEDDTPITIHELSRDMNNVKEIYYLYLLDEYKHEKKKNN